MKTTKKWSYHKTMKSINSALTHKLIPNLITDNKIKTQIEAGRDLRASQTVGITHKTENGLTKHTKSIQEMINNLRAGSPRETKNM